ncbi:PorP/SprF family type IX secretion system membrane protein [uncultured Pedobacter sp.]|uniref:PorP/SprF family type IX secretion system membrane protein n=1 Tax=uncultured Pedobacter sp. TaxID=246139 RepID=UPI0025D38967|nr:PorP/SprF family type IX secretion system membrane protein [uncultured Pedobacter sp.]
MTKKLLVAVSFFMVMKAQAQLNPMGTQYFLNQYLANPALAGTEPGYEAFGALKGQWSAIEGAPVMQAVTLTRGSENKKVGLGLYFYNESAGVIKRTSLKASYAYHLPINQGTSMIDFGLSAGYMNEWIDFNRVKGDNTDGSLANFNQRKMYFDGDFGIAYRNNRLTIQGTLPNLKRLMDRDIIRAVADRSLYMAAISYKLFFDDKNTELEPKVIYRGVQNYKDIVDIGANLSFVNGKLLFNGIYHSTNSVTLGIGTKYKDVLSIICQYTTNTADLQGYSNGEAEIGLKYHF